MCRYYYYVTLCGEYLGKFVDVFAKNKAEALHLCEQVYGFLKVSTVYTAKAWAQKDKRFYNYFGKVYNPAEDDYLRRRKVL